MTEVVQQVRHGRVVEVLPKQGQVLGQTPAAFRADVLRRAHASSPEAVEDIGLVVAGGANVVTVPGEPQNVHVTTPAEWWMASRLAGDVDGDATGRAL
jgi:2-C-methyl-D-erythritol 4-phosphate cytidylyltransferase